MIRLLISAGVHLLANAIGLYTASLILDGFNIDFISGLGAVLIFTGIEVLAGPLLVKISLQHIPALTGGVSLVTTFVGLAFTNLLSDGLTINGIDSLLAATFVVWLVTLLAGLILPLIFVKKAVDKAKENK